MTKDDDWRNQLHDALPCVSECPTRQDFRMRSCGSTLVTDKANTHEELSIQKRNKISAPRVVCGIFCRAWRSSLDMPASRAATIPSGNNKGEGRELRSAKETGGMLPPKTYQVQRVAGPS